MSSREKEDVQEVYIKNLNQRNPWELLKRTGFMSLKKESVDCYSCSHVKTWDQPPIMIERDSLRANGWIVSHPTLSAKNVVELIAEVNDFDMSTDEGLDDTMNFIIHQYVLIDEHKEEDRQMKVRLNDTIIAKKKSIRRHPEAVYNYKHYFANHVNQADLVVIHSDHSLKYAEDTGVWYRWTGNTWNIIRVSEVYELINKLRLFIMEDAMHIKDHDLREDVIKSSNRLGNRGNLNHVLEMIKVHSDVAISAAHMDQNINLVGLLNGVFDLKKSEFREATREDLVSYSLFTEYDADANCNTWLKFLDSTFDGDQELIDYIQKVIGYSLSGDTTDQVFWFAHGNGSNGKSTFFNTISRLFNDYYVQARGNLFIKTHESKDQALMALKGKRFVVGTEIERNTKMDTAMMKQLTGGEDITGRPLYKEQVTFTPTFHVFTYGNHKFKILDPDDAISRRLVPIPFLRKFTDKDKDPELHRKLELEMSGILNWAIEGYRKWNEDRSNGVYLTKLPHAVQKMKDDYLHEEDLIGQFLEEHIQVGDPDDTSFRVSVTDLYKSYKEWCEADGSTPRTKNNFNKDIKSRGFVQVKKSTMFWAGMSMKPTESVSSITPEDPISVLFESA